MIKEQKNRDEIIKSVKKLITDKSLVRSYIKGEASFQVVNQKGIKFAKPL